ncbi:MAG: hypothetical protein R3A79_03285 [Nannocystaceae bacterium]
MSSAKHVIFIHGMFVTPGASITDFKEFPGRDHFSVIGGPGWEEVADFVLAWIAERT